MLLGFKQRFRAPIIEGTKTQTIRKERKDHRRPGPGETLHLYTGLRTKQCAKIGTATCVSVHDIEITDRHVIVDGQIVATDEIEVFAYRDGFDSAAVFIRFFRQMHTLPFNGFLTTWENFKR